MSIFKSNHDFKTVKRGNEFHIILVNGLKDHYEPLADACFKYMPLLRTQSAIPDLKRASLHIFSFVTEVLFRKGQPELEALACSLLRKSIEKRYKSDSSQWFLFIGHGLGCWIIQRAMADNNPTTTSVMLDRICGVILWGQPKKLDDSGWAEFVACYIKNARKDAASLPAGLIRALEKDFETFEHHTAVAVPEIRRIGDSNLTSHDVSIPPIGLPERRQVDKQENFTYSPTRRVKSFYRRVRNISRMNSDQLFPSVSQSAMGSLIQTISEIYNRRVSQKRNPIVNQSVQRVLAPVQTNSTNALTCLQDETQPAPLDKSKKGTLDDKSMGTDATAMKLEERSGKAQEDGNLMKQLQDYARTYLFRGEYTQAWILYARISVLLQEQHPTKPKASASMLELDFEVRHQMAMKALREGELYVAKQAFEEMKKEYESPGLPQTVRWSLDHWLSVVYIELGSYKPAISLTESITRSVESQMSAYTVSYLEKLPDHRAEWLVLTDSIASSVGPHMRANALSYLEELPEHQAEWLVAHAKALTCLAKAREGQRNQLYRETEKLFNECKKTLSKSTEWNDESESDQTNDWKRPTHKEQSLRYMLTVAQVLMLVGRRRDAKLLIEHENYKDCARVLGKSHPLSIERLILETELLLPAATRDCDETFRELQNAMQRGYARLHPLTLSVCELQLAIFLRQGRLTEAMNATKDLISRIGAAHLGKNHFRSLQARRWQVRVLFERGEVSAALDRSKELTSTCEIQGSSSPMHTFSLACVVDSILMHLRLRHYATAENTVLGFLDELQISGEHTPGPDMKLFSSMAPKDVVPYLLKLPLVNESNTPAEQAFATFYLTALQCLYICYLARKAPSPETLDKLAEYLLDRRVRQSISSCGDLDSLMLLYNLAVIERDRKDFGNALKHLQEVQTGFINSLGHEHPHTLMVDFELMLVRLLRHKYDHVSETEKPLIGIEDQRSLSSGHGQRTVDSLDVLHSVQMQKKVLIRLDNSLGGSHIFAVAARIDLVNVLWELDNVREIGNLELEVIWYLLPCRRTSFPETPVLPFTASETKHHSWSQNQARVLRSKIHQEFDALLIRNDEIVQPIDERFLSAIASFAYNEHGRGHYEEAVTAQHAYAALCKFSGMDRAGLADALLELGYMRLELGYMHQSCADTCPDPTMSSERYMQAMKIYKDILQTEDMTPLYNAARSCLGAIYFRQGNFLLARNEQEKVYEALKELPTDDTYTFLDSIYNLALTEKLLNNKERAISLWIEGRDMSLQELGIGDEQTKLFNDKLRSRDVPLTRPSSAAGIQHGNQRDSVIASSPKKYAR